MGTGSCCGWVKLVGYVMLCQCTIPPSRGGNIKQWALQRLDGNLGRADAGRTCVRSVRGSGACVTTMRASGGCGVVMVLMEHLLNLCLDFLHCLCC